MNQLATSAAPSLQMADLSDFGGEPRVFDLRLAELLGYKRPRKIREVIRRNMAELVVHEQAPYDGAQIPTIIDDGISPHHGAKFPVRGRGRPEEGFLLNEAQAILITMFSRTDTAAEVRRQIIAVFIAWRHGRLGIPSELPVEDPDWEQDWHSPVHQRFMRECARIAPERGETIDDLLRGTFSNGQIPKVKDGTLDIEAKLNRPQLWKFFNGRGMDLKYVLTGVWNFTPQERWVVGQMRAKQEAHRLQAPPDQASIPCEP